MTLVPSFQVRVQTVVYQLLGLNLFVLKGSDYHWGAKVCHELSSFRMSHISKSHNHALVVPKMDHLSGKRRRYQRIFTPLI